MIARCACSSPELQAREEFAQRELSRVTELIGRGSATTQALERASMDLRQIHGLISVLLHLFLPIRRRRTRDE